MRGIPGKSKPFAFDQSCALWSKDIGLDTGDGLTNVGGRVLEIRKEKSRDAARSRRGKENYEFYELAKLLPLPAAITSQLDKASIIRLSISYLKLRDFCGHGDPPWNRDGQNINKSLKGGQRSTSGIVPDLFDLHQGAHILQSLDGFAFTLSNDGRFLYISETVSIYLGLSQVEMAGSSIFDYVHSQDHQELADQLGLVLANVSSTMSSPSSPTLDSPTTPRAITPPINERVPVMTPNLEKAATRSFCIRMKSTLTKRGVHSRSSGYRVVLIVGQFRTQINYSIGRKCQGPLLGMSAVAIALPPPTINELRIEADTFIMRLTANFKVIYCENIICTLTDWKCEDIIGKDLYEFCHPGDVHLMKKIHKDLLTKGQVMSPSIRILNKGGGYIWICVCCTSLYSSKTSDDKTVLAIFQTISSIEHRGVAMDSSQLSHVDRSSVSCPTKDDNGMIVGEDSSPISQTSEKSLEERLASNDRPEVTNCDEGASGENSTSVFPSGIDNDFLLDENIEQETEPVVKFDNKMSRRKTDRPRKRKRESEDSPCAVNSIFESIESNDRMSCSSERISNSSVPDSVDGCILNLSANQQNFPKSPNCDSVTSQQIPEDLSLRSDAEKRTSSGVKERHDPLVHNNIVSSSVHELEKAMDRHLPTSKKPFSVDDANNISLPSHKQGLHWNGLANRPDVHPSFPSPFYVSNVYTSRESVIRSSLRSHVLNGDTSVINMLTSQSGDVTINKDQLQLHIPHISVNTPHHFHSPKDVVSLANDFGMSPPASVSPHDKMPVFPEKTVTRDCLGMRIAQRQDGGRDVLNKHFSLTSDPNSDTSKGSYLNMPNYQYHSAEGGFPHGHVQPGNVLFDPRLPSNNAVWYSPAYDT
ncbi:Neuronal PAS domain-containing protein 3 [Mactra antiquata]